jgi:protein-tyrosine phosphatase
MDKKRIMFVCTGNICRSPLAQGVFEHLARKAGVDSQFEVESSGVSGFHVGENVDDRMRQTASKYGVKLNHRAQQMKQSDLDTYDMIFAMSGSHLSALKRMASESQREKIYMFREFDPQGSGKDEVPDPWYGGMNGFEEVFEIVNRTCENLVDTLSRKQAG